MNEGLMIDILEEYLKTEISNDIEKKDDNLIVKLSDGTMARVKVAKIS